ncbi:hypothetical protein [Stenotrophomonas bentonitica]
MKNKTYARLSTLSLALLLAGTNANAQTIVPPDAEQFTFGNSNSQHVIIDPDRPELNAPWSMQMGALNQSVIDNREEDFPSHNTQIGINNRIKGSNNFQFGMSNESNGKDNLQVGSVNVSEGQGNVQNGISQRALGHGNAQFGANGSTIEGDANVQLGGSSQIRGSNISTVGVLTQGLSDGCVALGSESACREGTEVSVGDIATGRTRRLTQVARGTLDQDAMTMEQGRAMAASLGGGATYNGGGYFLSPTYVYQSGATHYNVESALLDLDGRVYKIETQPVTPGTPGPAGQDGKDSTVPGPTGPAGQDGKDSTVPGPAGQDGKDGVGSGLDEMAVRYTNASKTTAELAGAGGTRVSNVSNGRIAQGSTDAVNGGQVWQLQQDLNDRWNTTNQRIDRLEGRMNDRMNAIGAKTAAISQVNVGGSYLEVGEGEFGMSPGFSSNKAALAAGYRFRTSEKWSFSGAISVGGGSPAMGAIGVHYKFSR